MTVTTNIRANLLLFVSPSLNWLLQGTFIANLAQGHSGLLCIIVVASRLSLLYVNHHF